MEKIDWVSFGYGFGSCGLIITFVVLISKLIL